MDDRDMRVALAERLAGAELEMQRAVAGRDGSPEARTRYVAALTEYRLAEAAALAALAGHALLVVTEAGRATGSASRRRRHREAWEDARQ